ncbi:hypothetical protein CIP107538_01296 [Corynebacterium diphtheriae]|nr:hypothetical protein CIP107538_01296 [Corynebacterium diphtheriae]CAB0862278.1 hypothetical protein FRC0378_01094 [Corynebacterium diphtheriae]CAB0903376.1 hypothetical protein FRC0425_01133 [Corynebacterium diphtheriae]CAB0904400.1 hypothetical protein FRC0420_01187 [Corynebacterium diphtheriae]CAB0928902.1 hypothetical protein FRC0435_01208 [Corynebacterium diphtheriae]
MNPGELRLKALKTVLGYPHILAWDIHRTRVWVLCGEREFGFDADPQVREVIRQFS